MSVCVAASVLGNVKTKTKGNLGDLFGYFLIEHYCQQLGMTCQRQGLHIDEDRSYVVVVGSIIETFARQTLQRKRTQLDVLGCGFIQPPASRHLPPSSRIRYLGVRGPLSQSHVRVNRSDHLPPVISDPGLLLSRIRPMPLPRPPPPKGVGFIIHSVDRTKFFGMFPEHRSALINNYGTLESFVHELSQYSHVVSSSLHGIIFCHSYGIPVCAVRITDRITGGDFKFQDYYHSVGHSAFRTRTPVKRSTDFHALARNAWMPSRETVQRFQDVQEAAILSYLASQR